jgi:hypothetical protein
MGHAGSASDARRARARLTDMLDSIQRARGIAGFCTVLGLALLAGLGGSIWCRGGGIGWGWSSLVQVSNSEQAISCGARAQGRPGPWMNPELNPEPSASLGSRNPCMPCRGHGSSPRTGRRMKEVLSRHTEHTLRSARGDSARGLTGTALDVR